MSSINDDSQNTEIARKNAAIERKNREAVKVMPRGGSRRVVEMGAFDALNAATADLAKLRPKP
jgi:hypothetical protein